VSASRLISTDGFVSGMANVKGQTTRRGVSDYPPLLVRVSPGSHAKLDQMAAALGVSKAAIVDAMLGRQELDDRGRPVWWSEPTLRDQEELPLTQSA
jgi:hypothetical protein